MIGITILWGIALGTIYLLWKAWKYNLLQDKEDKTEVKKAKYRLLIGSLAGMILFWFVWGTYLYLKNFTPAKLNPYISAIPIISMIPVGIIGIMIGGMLGLLSRKWKH